MKTSTLFLLFSLCFAAVVSIAEAQVTAGTVFPPGLPAGKCYCQCPAAYQNGPAFFIGNGYPSFYATLSSASVPAPANPYGLTGYPVSTAPVTTGFNTLPAYGSFGVAAPVTTGFNTLPAFGSFGVAAPVTTGFGSVDQFGNPIGFGGVGTTTGFGSVDQFGNPIGLGGVSTTAGFGGISATAGFDQFGNPTAGFTGVGTTAGFGGVDQFGNPTGFGTGFTSFAEQSGDESLEPEFEAARFGFRS